jgi:hypothetical protein
MRCSWLEMCECLCALGCGWKSLGESAIMVGLPHGSTALFGGRPPRSLSHALDAQVCETLLARDCEQTRSNEGSTLCCHEAVS